MSMSFLPVIGAKNQHLYSLVTQQGLVMTVLGSRFGIGAAWLAMRFIVLRPPKFLIVLDLQSILIVFLSSLLMDVLAALLSAWLLAWLDPVLLPACILFS